MAGPFRYDVSAEAAGISNGVLKNKLGLKDQKIIEDYEAALLLDSYTYYTDLIFKKEVVFDLSFLLKLHHYFLGTLYSWAGKTRVVDMSKGGTLFVPASFLSQALQEFDRILTKNKMAPMDSKKIIAQKLAVIHCEFNAIHPFREGNGRVIRLFLDLMVMKHGYAIIDYRKTSQKQYIYACIAGMQKKYAPMATIMYRGLKKRG